MADVEMRGQRILVTGFTGRLGGAFTDYLAKDNDVTAVSLSAADEQLAAWRERGVDPYVVDLAGDDYGNLPADFDYVVHTAAAVYPKTFADGLRDNADAPAFLMRHVRSAKAFLHVSTTGVYAAHPDPWYRHTEEDVTGGSVLMGHYTGTKNAGEGAVHAMARQLGLPTVICRMDVQYGTYSNGGLPVMFLANILNRTPIPLPKSYDWVKSLIHQDDLCSFIAPCLAQADVIAPVYNWAGDLAVKAEEWLGYLGELVGIEPIYDYDDAKARPGGAASPEKRIGVTGPAKVHWREGLQRIVEFWEPRIRSGSYA